MSKTIEARRLVGEYPGITRTIQIFDNKIIDIEFNLWNSDEIGIRFRKEYTDATAENEVLQAYFTSSAAQINRETINPEITKKSWIQLQEDAIADKVKLPDRAYKLHGNKKQLLDNIKFIKEKW